VRQLGLSVALVFSPAHYLPFDKYNADTILHTLWAKPDEGDILEITHVSEKDTGVLFGLFKEWVDRFQPLCDESLDNIPDAVTLSDDNPYVILTIEEDTPDD